MSTVADVRVFFNMIVGGGGTLQYAETQARRLFTEPGLVDEALVDLAKRREGMRHLKEPTIVRDPNVIAPWYSGPDEGDIFWPALKGQLLAEGFPEDALQDQVDPSSSKIVSYVEPPGEPHVDTRGLVVGHVQSGKTTSFTSVIAKAADRGYRVFIILSGIHDALRVQTHDRIHRQLIKPAEQNWFDLTHDGDFGSPMPAVQVLADDSRRTIAVVKKNGHRLRKLLKWLDAAPDEFLKTRAIMVIDDEADQASIDTGKTRLSTINQRIVDLLNRPKAAYVGYTATPFANLLISPDAGNLYPKDFVVDLPAPEGHFGTEKIFGRLPITEDENTEDLDGYDMVRHVPAEEVQVLRPPTKPDMRATWSPSITPTLETALRYFVLAAAARRARGDEGHMSMLVHTTMYADPQLAMRTPVKKFLDALRAEVQTVEGTARLSELWASESAKVPAADFGLETLSFATVREHLDDVLAAVEVVVDNYRSTDRLTYGDEPRVVVAIGGNTLSRGLTLEGLTVSYFVRAASAYDTLLQMGRWFGYRRGYEDLPRVWMTSDLHEWFVHLATVEAEIRSDIKRYEAENRTPSELAVRIRTHPAMAITARAKMRNAVKTSISYTSSRIQTILFHHRNEDWVRANLAATRHLVGSVQAGGRSFATRAARPGWWIAADVPWASIRDFLERYRFHENAADLNSQAIIRYVEGQRAYGSLDRWNVVVLGVDDSDAGSLDLGLGSPAGLIRRSRLNIAGLPYANIKALMSKVDRVADMAELDAVAASLSNEELQQKRPEGVGLLALYPIQAESKPARDDSRRVSLDATDDLIGVGLVFPEAVGKLGDVEYVAAFAEPNIEDADAIAAEAAQELDALDESQDEDQ